MTRCKFCGGLPDEGAHHHQGEPVCSECWDERLRTTQAEEEEGCKHTPDMTTAQFAEDASTGHVIVDVWCSKCGESGSCKLTPDDLMFDD